MLIKILKMKCHCIPCQVMSQKTLKNAERQTSKGRIAEEFPEWITVIELVFIYFKELLKQKKEKKRLVRRSIRSHLVYC